MRFHHLGVAAADPAKAVAFVRAGWPVAAEQGPIHDPLQDVEIVMLTLADGARIEIVSGARIAPYVQRGQLLYHVCFETDDMESAIARLRAGGALAVTKPQPAVLFSGRRVCFLNTAIGLVELLEAAP
jgi:catechol 2,3-dioxygenase-like lactoylglutathione lyase family enzyme